jgi:hypothetical protein
MLIGYLDYIEDQGIQTGSPLPVDDD